MTLEITDANFEELVLKTDKPVLLDFWAEWCGPCRIVGPFVEEIAKEFEGKAVVGKVDVDNNPDVASKFGIRNIPTILFFKDGEVVDKQIGVAQKAALIKKLEAFL
ncbi:MAG TPA: thioredoxin [Perlabentimonas sp.]|jgi:thioredoxin 1|nr:thioredoxin [Bacteroidales bacterium]MDD4673045.1 thioredoxin [Bacteroidales bacterium]MDY0349088.1 thioredoxin [Tenuifilaceae bacterium]HZJ73348.1 thioredoxin [Perlabentimonas sp.]